MEFLVGVCVGAVLLVVTFPFWFHLAVLLLWGTGFVDMGLNPTKPEWLQKIENRLKGKHRVQVHTDQK